MKIDKLSIERAFQQQKLVNGTIDFDQTLNILGILDIRTSMSFIEIKFSELDHSGIGRIDLKSFISLVEAAVTKIQTATKGETAAKTQTQDDDDNDDDWDEETIQGINNDKAKAFDKVKLLAQTNGSVTVTEIDKILKDIKGK